MPFYAFRLDSIHVISQRGKIPDDDLITFQISVNGAPRATAGVRLESLISGQQIDLAQPLDRAAPHVSIPPTTPAGVRSDWILGPCEIKPDDNVEIGFTGTNFSDWQLGSDTTKQDRLTLKLADLYFVAMGGWAIDGAVTAAAAGGLDEAADLGSKLSDELDRVSDPVGDFIGFKAPAKCNGVSFAGAFRLTGAALAGKPFNPPDRYSSLTEALEWHSDSGVLSDDKSGHDTSVCGHVAQTQVFFSVIRIAEFSLHRDFRPSLVNGLRRYLPAHQSPSLAQFLGLRA